MVVVEVTSPNTAQYDRTEKLAHYRSVPSLDSVVLVSHDELRLDLWRRTERGWLQTSAGRGERIVIDSIGCELAVDEVYAGSSLR